MRTIEAPTSKKLLFDLLSCWLAEGEIARCEIGSNWRKSS